MITEPYNYVNLYIILFLYTWLKNGDSLQKMRKTDFDILLRMIFTVDFEMICLYTYKRHILKLKLRFLN